VELGLQGRAAAVAASSRGLGRAVAVALAREGCDVAISARDEAALRNAEDEIRDIGVRVLATPLDLAKPDAAVRFVDGAAEAFGRLDVLFTNTGGPPVGGWDSFGDAEYHAALEANLLAHVRMCRAAVPHMRRGGYGRIVMLGSLSMKQPAPGLVLSTTARAGLTGFAKSLADEIASSGITVNCIAPGRILTDRIRSLADERARRTGEPIERALQAFESDIPLGRMGAPDELAALAVFLASERASYVTGTVIPVDGGMSRSLT
jgi:3-oxoacyl-[acyl-carrier protein] reductase